MLSLKGGHMLKRIILTAISFSATHATADEAGIPMLGQTADGKVIETSVPEGIYTDRLKTAISNVEISTLRALKQRKEDAKPFMLRSVVVGLGVNMELKVGPVIRFGALPRFRVGFSNAKEPSIP